MARKKRILFCDFYEEWIETYKVGAIAAVTLDKYYMSAKHLRNICPNLTMDELNDRREYQHIINVYSETHEKQTTTDFHHQIKGCILDAFHDGILQKDPTYRTVIKGKEPREKKRKFLQKEELSKLLKSLDLHSGINRDWFILLAAKTGIRFSEALALTPADFNWQTNELTIDKTWDYKNSKGFSKTKTPSSIRTIAIDWQIVGQFKPLVENLDPNEPIFVEKLENGQYKRQFNSTYNKLLLAKCKSLGITEITLHALRHTHASVLLAEGVSINTISARLGHADVGVTQDTYSHILDELKKKDDEKMMSVLMQIA